MTHNHPTTATGDRQRDEQRLAWRALGLAAAAQNFESARWWLSRLRDLGAPLPAPKRELRRGLVFLDRDAACCGCGRPIYAGTEAQRVLGMALAHVACADDTFAGPAGR